MDIIKLHKKICAENETLGFKSDADGGNELSSVLLYAMQQAFALGQKSILVLNSGAGGSCTGVQIRPHCGSSGVQIKEFM